MSCGVYLGILLICLVKAEHVDSLWASQAQRQEVGLSARSGRVQPELGRSQDQLRQAPPSAAQSSSLLASGVHSGGASKPSPPQPTGIGRAAVRVKVSSRSTPVPTAAPQEAGRLFRLSTDIASGSAVSQYFRGSGVGQGGGGPRGRSPAPAGDPQPRGAGRQPLAPRSSGALVQSQPKSSSVSMKSRLFSDGAPQPRRHVGQPPTSARAPARLKTTPRGASLRPSAPASQMFLSGVSGPSPRGLRTHSGSANSASVKIYDIPQAFGGFPIRRRKKPDEPNRVQQASLQMKRVYSPPTYTQPQKVNQSPLQQTHTEPQKVHQAPVQTKRVYNTPAYPQPQRVNQSPLQQTHTEPQKVHQAPVQTKRVYNTPAYPLPRKVYQAPPEPKVYQAPVQPKRVHKMPAYPQPQGVRQTMVQQPPPDPKRVYQAPPPQVPSVHRPSEWKRVRPASSLSPLVPKKQSD